MANIFSGSEVVQLGINIEENGRDFYNTLAQESKNTKTKNIFKFLAGEEEKHIMVFQGILQKTEEFEPQGMGADEYYAYMNSLASQHVFTQKDKGREIAKSIKTDQEAIDKGISFEKDSIVFYEGIKRVVPAHDHKIVDSLIEQEKSHLEKLTELKQTL